MVLPGRELVSYGMVPLVRIPQVHTVPVPSNIYLVTGTVTGAFLHIKLGKAHASSTIMYEFLGLHSEKIVS